MNNAVTVYDNIADPVAAVERFGTILAKSRMFGCENEQQGMVLAMACLAERRNPIELKRTYHIIDGNLSMRADAMLAELRGRGGKHKVVERTAEAAEIEVAFDGQTLRERLTWSDAQLEPWPFRRDGKTLKTNWATPRARRQMLWARVVSEIVRTIAPEVVAGVYTPEETGEFSESESTAPKPVDVEKLMQQTAAAAAADQAESEPIDAEFQVVDTPTEEPPRTDQVEGMSTVEQRRELRDLFDKLGATADQVNKALEKRGAKSFRELTNEQAAELVEALRVKVQAAAEAATDAESRLPADATSSDVTGPVAQATVDKIKSLLAGDYATAKRLQDHLRENGLAKIADLSQTDADALLQGLESKATEEFFARSIDRPPF